MECMHLRRIFAVWATEYLSLKLQTMFLRLVGFGIILLQKYSEPILHWKGNFRHLQLWILRGHRKEPVYWENEFLEEGTYFQ